MQIHTTQRDAHAETDPPQLTADKAGGRQVVLISHVPSVAERAGAGVRVVPRARGASAVETGAPETVALGSQPRKSGNPCNATPASFK